MALKIVKDELSDITCDAVVCLHSEANQWYRRTMSDIFCRGGMALWEAFERLGGLTVGEPAVTEGYSLASRFVIHLALPDIKGGDAEADFFRSCYTSCLNKALELGCESIALPLLTEDREIHPSKIRHFSIAMSAIREFLEKNEMLIYLVTYPLGLFRIDKRFPELDKYIEDRSPRLYSRLYYLFCGAYEELIPSPDTAHKESISSAFSQLSSDIEADPSLSCADDIDADISLSYTEDIDADNEDFENMDMEEASPHISASLDLSAHERRASMVDFPSMCAASPSPSRSERAKTLEEMIAEFKLRRFADTLFLFIQESGMTDVECYKRANVDKKTFSKIRCNEKYTPSKRTVLAFAIALRLSLEKTQELLATVGFTLGRGSIFDIILEYFITHEIYNIFEINETLFHYDQPILGS